MKRKMRIHHINRSWSTGATRVDGARNNDGARGRRRGGNIDRAPTSRVRIPSGSPRLDPPQPDPRERTCARVEDDDVRWCAQKCVFLHGGSRGLWAWRFLDFFWMSGCPARAVKNAPPRELRPPYRPGRPPSFPFGPWSWGGGARGERSERTGSKVRGEIGRAARAGGKGERKRHLRAFFFF